MVPPEKALCDLIANLPGGIKLRYKKEAFRDFLEENLRFDMDRFYQLNPRYSKNMHDIGKKSSIHTHNIKTLTTWMRYTKICYQLMIFLQIRLKEMLHFG